MQDEHVEPDTMQRTNGLACLSRRGQKYPSVTLFAPRPRAPLAVGGVGGRGKHPQSGRNFIE